MSIIDLHDKVALVTGSARRVGRAIALALAAQGMHNIVHYANDSSQAEAESCVKAMQHMGVHASLFQADLTQPDQIDLLFEHIRTTHGRLDVLVNSAASFHKGSILEISLAEWQEVLALNLTAPFLCSQRAARLMRDHGGSIVNIIDTSALHVWKSYPHHSVSKAALKSLTEVLALSLGPNIRVNAIAPGPVLRDEGNSPEKWRQISQRLPLRVTGDPDDVAQAVIFLVTQPFITGTTLLVNGGEHLIV